MHIGHNLFLHLSGQYLLGHHDGGFFVISDAAWLEIRRNAAFLLKIVPLGIYVRAVACKLEFPVLMCDGPLCPLAIGQEATDGCSPTGNTAEVKAWCEHGWAPWLNGLLATAGLPLVVTCDEATGFLLMKAVAVMMIIGYTLLWSSPRLGAPHGGGDDGDEPGEE